MDHSGSAAGLATGAAVFVLECYDVTSDSDLTHLAAQTENYQETHGWELSVVSN